MSEYARVSVEKCDSAMKDGMFMDELLNMLDEVGRTLQASTGTGKLR